MRGAQTWEEAHRVVLEIEQREATNRATANAVYAAAPSASAQNPDPRPNANPQGPGSQTKGEGKAHPGWSHRGGSSEGKALLGFSGPRILQKGPRMSFLAR